MTDITKEKEGLTCGQLIEKLQKFDPNLPALCYNGVEEMDFAKGAELKEACTIDGMPAGVHITSWEDEQ